VSTTGYRYRNACIDPRYRSRSFAEGQLVEIMETVLDAVPTNDRHI
jgi:hypothetical protein